MLPGPSGGRDHPVRVDHVLLRYSLEELLVAPRGVVQRDDGGVDRLRDLGLVVQDAHHQAAVVLQHRTLAGDEGVALGPAEAEPHLERALLRVLVRGTGVTGHVEAGNAQPPTGPVDSHDRVQQPRRGLPAAAVRTALEPARVDGAVDIVHAEERAYLLVQGRALRDAGDPAAERPRLL